MMMAENISFSYNGQEPYIINDFTLPVGRRDRICIIGKNGRGKSTLLKVLAGELKPLKGTITKHPSLQEGYFCLTKKQVLKDSLPVTEEIMSADTGGSLQPALSRRAHEPPRHAVLRLPHRGH
jgi:ATP-binding cassette subfamily F protein 3